MKSRPAFTLIELLLACAIIHTSVGCRTPAPAPLSKTYEKLIKIDQAYQQAIEKHQRAPASIDELMPFLKELGEPTELLRSDDDKQDFVIVWGVDVRVFEQQGVPPPITACETIGKDGKRYVLRSHQVFRMTDDEIRQLPLPPGFKAPI